MGDIDLDVTEAAWLVQQMYEAGIRRCDIDKLSGPQGPEFLVKIRQVLTGESELQPLCFSPATQDGERSHHFKRKDDVLLLDDVPLRLIRCAEVAESYGELCEKYRSRVPPESVLEVLAEHPHMLPEDWCTANSDMWLIFLSTREDGTVGGIYIDDRDGPVFDSRWSADDADGFEESDYLVVIGEPG